MQGDQSRDESIGQAVRGVVGVQPRIGRGGESRLPAGHRLLRVGGESIRAYEFQGGQTIRPRGGTDQGIAPNYRLTVETEAALGAVPTAVKMETPHALGVKREMEVVARRHDAELAVTAEAGGLKSRLPRAAPRPSRMRAATGHAWVGGAGKPDRYRRAAFPANAMARPARSSSYFTASKPATVHRIAMIAATRDSPATKPEAIGTL
jgi:hypothetical protein